MFQLKKVFCVIAQFSPKSNTTRQKAREKKGRQLILQLRRPQKEL